MMEAVTITVNLPEPMAVAFRSWAEENNKTFTQGLKEAILLKLFVENHRSQNTNLILEWPDGSQREVTFKKGGGS